MEHSGLAFSALTLLGGLVLVGFYSGRLARRITMPSLIGYMLLGAVLGPSGLHLLNESMMEHTEFITQVALGFVAFSIGSELRIASLKRLGYAIVLIIFAESFMAFTVVAVAIFLLTGDLPMALVFGAMAPASAPAGTVAVIQECKSKGTLTQALYAVVGFDDGLAIIIFGFAAAMAKSLIIADATGQASNILPSLVAPALEVGLSVVVGTVLGFLFCQLLRSLHNSSEILIVVFGVVLLATGLSIRWHLSLILTNMVVGFVLVNTRREALVHRVQAPILEIMPLLFVLFFTLAGAHLDLGQLGSLGFVGVIYIIGRSFGLLSGAWLGAVVGGAEEKIRKYLGLGILSQAGVAIGLALMINSEFAELGAEYGLAHITRLGASVLTTITATSIFFEVIGPILTKIALRKAGEINAA